MKKYIFKTAICAALTLPLTTACELDQLPEGTITTEQSWEKIEDANNYYVGLLSNLRSISGGGYNYVSEVQSDLFNVVRGASSQTQVHEWTFTTSQFSGDAIWTGNYGMIANANNIINNIDNIQVETTEDQEYLDQIKGAAYFARAYGYANMVVRYCKNYDAATASKELGLPLVTTVDVNAKPSRSSLQATYDLIMSDITKAEALLPVYAETTVPTGYTLMALKARVCLYMQDYEQAIDLANELIDAYPLGSDTDYMLTWEADDATYETIYQPLQTVDERSNSYGSIFINYNIATEGHNPYFLPTQGLMDLYERGDIRKSTFFTRTTISPVMGTAADNAKGYMFYKFPGNPELLKSGETTGLEGNTWYNMHKPFRVAEMYLIAAEANLFKAAKDEAAAQQYLTNLRTARGASAMTKTGDELVTEMKNEWVREFVGEGFRLNCLKRWNDPVVRMAPQDFGGKNILNNMQPDAHTQLAIEPTDYLYYKMVWEIPSQDMQANKNLVGNWPTN